MNKKKSSKEEIEVLGQTGVLDVVKTPEKEKAPKKKKPKKEVRMNLKTLFGLGLGVVGLIVVIIIIAMSFCGKKYTVSFDTDGGSKIASIRVKEGKKLTLPNDPTKKDYTFVEWQLDGKKFDTNTKISKNIKLKAIWEVHLTDDIFTITFNTKGGTPIESQEVNGNGQVLKPEDPTKENSKFVEWQLDGKTYNFDSLVKKDITLEAKWSMLPTYNVKFDTDGGNKVPTQVVSEGGTVEKPQDPVKDGYVFVEWKKSGQKYNFETPVVEDMVLVAKYEEAKMYTVTFDTDGGTTIEPQTVQEKNKVTKPQDPTKEGYAFVRWELDGVPYNFDKEVEKDITIKAIWSEIVP